MRRSYFDSLTSLTRAGDLVFSFYLAVAGERPFRKGSSVLITFVLCVCVGMMIGVCGTRFERQAHCVRWSRFVVYGPGIAASLTVVGLGLYVTG